MSRIDFYGKEMDCSGDFHVHIIGAMEFLVLARKFKSVNLGFGVLGRSSIALSLLQHLSPYKGISFQAILIYSIHRISARTV